MDLVTTTRLLDVSTPTIEVSTPTTIAISDEALAIFTWVVVTGLCQAVDMLGVGSNIINIMCFVKQGFEEPVNISLFGLAVCDLGCLVSQIGINIGYTILVGAVDVNIDVLEVTILVACIPHLSFSRVNCWITAIIAIERCLCITVPLKVKGIITPRRVWILISCVFIILLFSGTPIYYVNRLAMKFSSSKNRTILGFVSTADKDKVEGITYAINSFLLPFVAFIVISICTLVLVVNLGRKSNWRQTATKTVLSSREQRVAKMVVMISALFIVCFIPVCINLLAIAFEPGLKAGGKYINISSVCGYLGLVLESVNSSCNIFIYYYMSTKYRDTLRSFLDKSKLNYI